jgi:hypothetical protein
MNDGANVFELGVPFFELDCGRGNELILLGATTPASEEYDWFRLCGGLCVEDNGDDNTMDLGRPLELLGAGDCDPVRENGLLRFCPGCDDILKSFCCIRPAKVEFVMLAKQHQAMESWKVRQS